MLSSADSAPRQRYDTVHYPVPCFAMCYQLNSSGELGRGTGVPHTLWIL